MNSPELQLLHDFNDAVLEDIQTAQGYATNRFLDAIAELITPNNQVDTIKDALRAFGLVVPHVFKTICQNETETKMWQTTKHIISIVRKQLADHDNFGVRLHAMHCFLNLILLFTKPENYRPDEPTLNMVRANHQLLNGDELFELGKSLFQNLLGRLRSSASNSASLLTAIVNVLATLARRRVVLQKYILNAFVNVSQNPPSGLDAQQKRDVDKAVKVALVALIRSETSRSKRDEMIQAFQAVGGNPASFQRLSKQGKRPHPSSSSNDNAEKRHRPESATTKAEPSTSTPPTAPAAALPSIDVTTIPHSLVLEIVFGVLQNISLDVVRERIASLPANLGQLPYMRGPVDSQLPLQPQPTQAQPQPSLPLTPSHPLPVPSASISAPTPPQTAQTSQPPIKREPAPREEPRPARNLTSTNLQPGIPLASVEERASQSLKTKPYKLVALPEDSAVDSLSMTKKAVQRMFEAASGAPNAGETAAWNLTSRTVWLYVLGKVIGRETKTVTDADGDTSMDVKLDIKESITDPDMLKEMLLEFCVGDLPERYDIAGLWLTGEYLRDQKQSTHDFSKWLLMTLEKGIPTLAPKDDKTLQKLIRDVPSLNADAIELLKKNMKEEFNRFIPCASVLFDQVDSHTKMGNACLDVLLEFCTDADVKRRSHAIVAVKKWVPNDATISPLVESYALNALQRVKESPPPTLVKTEAPPPEQDEEMLKEEGTPTGNDVDDDMQQQRDPDVSDRPDEDSEDAWSETDVVRHIELYFALCHRKNALLEKLYDVYIHASGNVKRYVRIHISRLIKAIGMKSADLLEIIRHFPAGGESLTIQILESLCENAQPTPELVAVVKSVYAEKGDIHFLIPTISGFSKNDILQNLSSILNCLNETEEQRKVVTDVFTRMVSGSATAAAPMTAAEVLEGIINSDESLSLRKSIEAIQLCVSLTDLFTSKEVAAALTQVSEQLGNPVEQSRRPVLVMVTMIRCVPVHKDLHPFILSLMQKLISKKIWRWPNLWKGFLRCIEDTLPGSVKAIVGLPDTQLEDVLRRIPNSRSPLREYAEQNQLVRVLVMMKKLNMIEE